MEASLGAGPSSNGAMDEATAQRLWDALCADLGARGSDVVLADRLRAAADAIDPSRRGIGGGGRRGKKAKQLDQPDWSSPKIVWRKVALRVAYFGWRYYGFARQRDVSDTIEAALFAALQKCRLIPLGDVDPELLEYSRCGRTDKGVSAAGQVIALRLRSPGAAFDYVAAINRHLPDDIRVTGCRAAAPGFNARFGCRLRHYKYFFVDDGSLDLAAMRVAAKEFEGAHDFQNFCKNDPNVKTTVRNVYSCRIEDAGTPAHVSSARPHRLYAINVVGSAFLWHQVRCMAAVLFTVGRRKVPTDERGWPLERWPIDLLDLSVYPERPSSYTMAREEPLLLYRCEHSDYDGASTPTDGEEGEGHGRGEGGEEGEGETSCSTPWVVVGEGMTEASQESTRAHLERFLLDLEIRARRSSKRPWGRSSKRPWGRSSRRPEPQTTLRGRETL